MKGAEALLDIDTLLIVPVRRTQTGHVHDVTTVPV